MYTKINHQIVEEHFANGQRPTVGYTMAPATLNSAMHCRLM